jgi:hypothetical protein
MVAEMCFLGWEEAKGEAWVSRDICGLWAWEEEMLRECQVLLQYFI